MKYFFSFLFMVVLFTIYSEAKPKGLKINCKYDNNNYMSSGVYYIKETGIFSCKTSFVSSLTPDRINISLSNIAIKCNGFNDIELIDQNGRYYYYCDYKPVSVVNFGGDKIRWISITRYGQSSFTLKVQFPSTSTTTSTTTRKTTTTTTRKTTTTSEVRPVTTTTPGSIITNFTSSCGLQAIKPDETGLRIVGGSVARANSWPWQAALVNRGNFFCGGSIINNQWILTAAHCQTSVTGLVANLGEHNIYDSTDGQISYTASKWISHPQYNSNNQLNDIALIKLTNPINFNTKISPVCLPAGKKPVVGSLGIVTGWGTTAADGNGNISPVLKQVVIPILPLSAASSLYGNLPTSQIYAGVISNSTPGDSCQGDSGGPFVQKDKTTGAYYVVGVVSYGYQCAGNGVYSNVAEYESWIASTIANN